MRTITFYSYKGGVGRTLALANIAKRLAEFGKKVCLMDFDLEAPGLHHKFKDSISGKGINQGLVDYIYYFNTKKTLPKSLHDYVTPIDFGNEKFKNIDFIAAGNIYTNEYWKTLFSIDWVSMFYKKNSNGVALFVDLKERIQKELKPDYLLIDSRTGISEISGITMSLLADEIVLLAAKNDENIQGIKQIINSISLPENTLSGKLPKLNFVLCRIPYFERPEEKIIEQRAINEVNRDLTAFINKSKLPIEFDKVFVIHSDPTLEIEEKLLMGYQYEKEENNEQLVQRKLRKKSPIATDYLELFEELTKGQLSDTEKQIFNDLKKAEFLIERAQNIPDANKKIEFLSEAIILNPKSDEAFALLSNAYYSNGDFANALNKINEAISLNLNSIDYLSKKGYIINTMGNIEDSKTIFQTILERDNKNFIALSSLGSINYNNKNFEKALEYYLEIVKFYPDFAGGYNNVGNVYRVQKKHAKAFEFIFKALELDPKHITSTGTLAEIYAQVGNNNEFYKNFELSLSFGMLKEDLEKIFFLEDVYKPYFKEPKFLNLLKKYNFDIDLSKFI